MASKASPAATAWSRRALLMSLSSAAALALAERAAAQTITYTYDELGRLKTATYPSGMVVTYSYDAADNRTQVVSQIPDVTPASVNWANISGNSGATNASQTISGINQAITLTIGYTGSGSIQYSLNSGSYTSIAHNGTISGVAASDTLSFKANVASGSASGTVTVTNTTDGSATLDTFTYSVTAAGDVTPDTVNWGYIAASGIGTAYGQNSDQTINGIDSPITLSVIDSNGGSYCTLIMVKNGWDESYGGGTVSAYDTVRFRIVSDMGSGYFSGTFSVYNDTDGGALLDTFPYDITF